MKLHYWWIQRNFHVGDDLVVDGNGQACWSCDYWDEHDWEGEFEPPPTVVHSMPSRTFVARVEIDHDTWLRWSHLPFPVPGHPDEQYHRDQLAAYKIHCRIHAGRLVAGTLEVTDEFGFTLRFHEFEREMAKLGLEVEAPF